MKCLALKMAGAVLAAVLISGQAAPPQEPLAEIRVVAPPLSLSQPRAVTSLDIDPAGETILATGLDGAVRLWALSTGAPGPVFQVHQGDAASAEFTGDGRRILSTGADGQAVLSDVRSGEAVQTWRFPTWCLGLSILSEDQAAIGCADLKIRILDLETGRTEREIQAPGDPQYGYIGSLTSSRDGRFLVSNNPATLFDLQTGEQLKSRPSFLQNMVLSPDGRRLLGGNMKANAELWDVETLEPRRGVLTDVERQAQTPSGPQTVRFRMPVYGVTWSPDGRYFATGGLDRLVRVWKLQDFERPIQILQLEGHESAVSALTWQGERLVSGDLGGHIRVWTLGIPDSD